jgi:hypothetical protein
VTSPQNDCGPEKPIDHSLAVPPSGVPTVCFELLTVRRLARKPLDRPTLSWGKSMKPRCSSPSMRARALKRKVLGPVPRGMKTTASSCGLKLTARCFQSRSKKLAPTVGPTPR